EIKVTQANTAKYDRTVSGRSSTFCCQAPVNDSRITGHQYPDQPRPPPPSIGRRLDRDEVLAGRRVISNPNSSTGVRYCGRFRTSGTLSVVIGSIGSLESCAALVGVAGCTRRAYLRFSRSSGKFVPENDSISGTS